MPNYGSDLKGTEDLDAFLTFLDEDDPEVIAEAQVCRFDTARGALHYDESYGMILTQFILDNLPTEVAEQLIVSESLKDERVVKCLTKITVQKDGSWKVQINPVSEDGVEYELTFLADSSKASLLTSRQVGA